ncbi:carbohydrate ABC transporter permease [Buchananella hordeovulneris]|uniref:Sugar ABC transporter permease n=1 Tax=Buchananella hordeovulneris TaxID=52770 RepID=A0A1Q5PUM4_9ACTO|nr:sugar ABC transporter permease [Buchananella hordeovulneris]MDO5081737.1 sugar ABC transporter permease [Buchananella hordeovulneris]OKL51268.1 sugar ABC transporter permease [Buchananella hordeovulneris]RRD43423.1 sugar ABC transporter permease [Buchananella hordeovulneris]RRD52761.1 sugar ABC transporter permease [Buchananella hordeovulneris]
MASATAPVRLAPRRRLADRTFYWMVWPAVILFALFHTVPVLIGVFFSFTNYAGYGNWRFVGLENYFNLFQDDRALGAYGFSFLFALVATVLTNVIALAIALGLNAKIRARSFFRGVYFVPYVLPVLVIGYVFQFLFSNSLPKLLANIPLFADNILTNETWAWLAIVALAVWQGCAFAIIIYLSGLQTIPTEVYEAAELDGASPWRRFRSITFPLIGAFFTINVVLSLKGYLQVFDPIMSLTQGGPGTATESVTLLIFRSGFAGGEFAYQTANAVVFFLVITVVSLAQLKTLQNREADF